MSDVATAASASGRRRGLIAVIASITIVGIMISAVAPLLSLNLEQRGVGAGWNGLLAAMPPLAALIFGVFMPMVIRRIGAAPSIYLGAGVSAMALLLFPVFQQLPAWFALRFAMGVGMGVVWVVSEAWVNALAPENNRGAVMGIYVTVLCVGLASGPLIVGLIGSKGALPFVATAIILAIALLPIPFASGSGGAPSFHDPEVIPLTSAVGHAPVIMIAALLNGAIWTTQLALLPVYGVRAGLPEGQALILLTAFIFGSAVFQLPIGRLLDRWSGRSVLVLCGAIQCLGAIVLPFVVHHSVLVWLWLLIWGGFLAGLYTTELTMIGRSFATKELPGASTVFSMAFNFGALSGPALAGAAMQIWDPHGMLVVIGAAGAGVAIMSMSFAGARQPVPSD
jgi:MFS family permease